MLFLAVSASPASAQEVPDAAAPTNGDTLDNQKLDTCREGILDADARDQDRRRWTVHLFSYDSPEANALIVSLLAPTQRVAVRRTVCEVMADTARTQPERIVADFVPPLLDMLGAAEPELRSAAAHALADFPRDGLADRLGAIAANEETPLDKRLAAIEALARNTHRREVVKQLIQLLDSPSSEIRTKVTECLEPASLETFGDDVARWKQWWQDKSQLTDEQWLEAQLQIYRARSRRVRDAFEAFKNKCKRDGETTIAHLKSFQRELFRALPAEQRRQKLIEWLASPVAEVKLTALNLIKTRIADEGKPPEGEVLAALVGLLRDGTDQERRDVLLIVQNVNDPSVVEAVIARLDVETDETMRLAILAALGRLRSPAAIPALIRELSAADASAARIAEAANALGRIAERIEDKQTIQDAVEPLKQRFAEAPPDDVTLRAALLSAMAGVGDRAFGPAFAEAVDSDDPALLQPAIHGLRIVHDRTKLPRIRDLTRNPDPLVRLAAIVAVSELGREAEDLQSLLTCLNPTIEPNELAREAAWRGFREYMSRRPVPERIDAAQRLRNMPDLEARYLSELSDTLAATGTAPMDLERVRDRLGQVLVGQGKFAEATDPLRKLFAQQADRQAETAIDTAVRWLDAALRARPPMNAGDVLKYVTDTVSSDADRLRLIEAVARYADDPGVAADRDRSASLLTELQSVPAEGWPAPWTELLQRLTARTQPPPPAQPPTDPPQ